jgi:hypothetical protein
VHKPGSGTHYACLTRVYARRALVGGSMPIPDLLVIIMIIVQ